jgi:hypothetical protein
MLSLSLLVLMPASVLATPRYVQLDLSSHFNQSHGADEYGVFISSLPEGLVTFSSGVPLQFSRQQSVIVQNTNASLTTDAVRAKAVHLLINAGFALTDFIAPGERVGRITLVFDKGPAEVTQLVIGSNIREWRQIGDCGSSVTLTRMRAWKLQEGLPMLVIRNLHKTEPGWQSLTGLPYPCGKRAGR